VFSTPLSTLLLLLLLTASSSSPSFSSRGCPRRAFSCVALASASVFVARKSGLEAFAGRGFCEGRTAEDDDDDDDDEEEVEVTRIQGNTEEDEGDNNNNVVEEDLRRNFVVNSVFFVLSWTRG